ncbi:MAG TPA: tRNA glutamyl-Q(34) synthetase GluQRS [Dokdonella sp.]|uniref:tRNA glutamyl-Q(34) synthetase GluQRS n=1 Tax=Dokdonella sp. TaxID=2291710 RepID=UPI002D802A10|nr:tRNA glutamyl-Q(34) synthetase GluQRS [Dokdonella sp.]HET9032275.1 tRNA glutamyl-Q(34) synthetase GluQRS [Dokdonella sp.]
MTEVPQPVSKTACARPVRGRFAPSPSGNLHFGSLVAALGSWLRARSLGGTWIVRMEDIDSVRCVEGAAARILASLAAFGLESDEAVVCQSERLPLYESALQKLKAAGHAYPCRCSRNDLASFNGIHPAQCVPHARSTSPAWRLRVGRQSITFRDAVFGEVRQDLDREVGDFVLRRADGTFTYQLVVVVDDAEQDINEIVRGADLLDSTPRQIHLQQLLGLPSPDYLHLPVALDPKGRKLSKQDCDRPVDGSNPLPALREALAFLGQPIPAFHRVDALLQAAAARFDVAAIPTSRPAHVAMQKD